MSLYRSQLNTFRRNNFRSRTFNVVGKRYGRFFAGPLFCAYGQRSLVSNRMSDRFMTDNIRREIYKYSFHHRRRS